MAKQTDRRLVIDADIARSAGESEHPVSRASRRFLETMLKVGHMVVMTKAITEEWRRHRSGFSAKWLVQMYGRRKVYRCNAEHDEDLRNRIAAAVPVNRSQAAEKDVHLIEAARRTDLLIASQDQRARSVFRAASVRVLELKPIVWVNPTLSADEPICWLRNGAQSDAHRRLGQRAP